MDDTLYPRSCGLNLACRKKIEGMIQHVDNLKWERTQVVANYQ